MARATQVLTTGLKILSGSDVPVYTLEYLTTTALHKQGDFEKIVVPYIELGRDSNCVVNFGEEAKTVSRKHAAISRNGKEVIIKNLSAINPTLVNGRPVKKEYFLNSGDEIQLSIEGPRLRFNTSSTGTAKMGFTNKMNLVIQQAVKPYKMAVTGIFLALILVTGGGGYALFYVKQTAEEQIASLKMVSNAQADSLMRLNKSNQDLSRRFEIDKREWAQKIAAQSSIIEKLKNEIPPDYASVVKSLQPNIYAMFLTGIEVSMNGESSRSEIDPTCMCTGFVIEGGYFVTARHCIDFGGSLDFQELNLYANNGGTVNVTFEVISSDKSQKFTLTSDDFTMGGKDGDEFFSIDHNGSKVVLRNINILNGTDWAFAKLPIDDGASFDLQLSENLRSGDELLCLGYSYGLKFRNDPTNLEPYFTQARVATSGLDLGIIRVTEFDWDGGNSGGPLFKLQGGIPVIIGIVSGTQRKPEIGEGQAESGETVITKVMVDAKLGIVTPISQTSINN